MQAMLFPLLQRLRPDSMADGGSAVRLLDARANGRRRRRVLCSLRGQGQILRKCSSETIFCAMSGPTAQAGPPAGSAGRQP